jgi:hypothetical protein
VKILAVLVLVACGKGEKTKEAPTPTGGSAGDLSQLRVTLDKTDFAPDRAFIRRSSTDVYTVLVGKGKGSCESLLAGTEDPTGKAFSLTLTKRVAPSGHENWFVTDLWSRDFGTDEKKLPVAAKVTGTAEKGATTTVELSGLASKQLQAAGTLVAVGCGDAPAPTGVGVPKDPKKMAGTITIAGKQLQIRGATVRKAKIEGLPDITLSTNVKDCSDAMLPAQVILERKEGKWSLRGTWFEAPIEGADDATKELNFSANAIGKDSDGSTLVMQLTGSGKIGEYSVKLGGTAEALECVR